MINKEIKNTAKKLVNAFNTGQLIAPLANKFTKNSVIANQLRTECESLVKSPIIGFKAGGTGKAMLKKWGEKEPFYAAIFKKKFIKKQWFSQN